MGERFLSEDKNSVYVQPGLEAVNALAGLWSRSASATRGNLAPAHSSHRLLGTRVRPADLRCLVLLTISLQHLQSPHRNSNDTVACVQNSDTHCSSSPRPDSSQVVETLLLPAWPASEPVIQGWKTEYPISSHLLSPKDFTCLGAPASCVQWARKGISFSPPQASRHLCRQKSRQQCPISTGLLLPDMPIWQHPTCCFREGYTKLRNSPGKHQEELKFPFWRWPCKAGTLPPNTYSLWLGIKKYCLITLKTVSQGPDPVYKSRMEF